MKRFRFHLGSLVTLVLVLGIGLAALRESTAIWDSSIFSAAAGLLLIAVLLAIHRTEKKRAFWIGFTLFGWVYLGLSLVPSIESRLITTRGLACLPSKIPRSIAGGLAYFDYDNDGWVDLYVANTSLPNSVSVKQGNGTFENVFSAAGSNTALFLSSLVGPGGKTEHFVRIGHSLLALIAALMGGQISRYLFAKNREPVHE
jgi:FG-GAP-like repeat